MRRQRYPVFLFQYLLLVLAGGIMSPGYGVTLDEINSQIETAEMEGRNWPTWPGGICGHFFGLNGRVLPRSRDKKPSQTEYGETTIVFEENGHWFEIGLEKNSEGYWTAKELYPGTVFRSMRAKWISNYFSISRKARCGFDYQETTPSIFLAHLAKKRGRIFPIGESSGWIRESDIPALIDLLDSKEPCTSVMSFFSSTIDTSWSTVGNEAAYLIAGYREDRYPPGLVSQHHRWKKEEVLEWWYGR